MNATTTDAVLFQALVVDDSGGWTGVYQSVNNALAIEMGFVLSGRIQDSDWKQSREKGLEPSAECWTHARDFAALVNTTPIRIPAEESYLELQVDITVQGGNIVVFEFKVVRDTSMGQQEAYEDEAYGTIVFDGNNMILDFTSLGRIYLCEERIHNPKREDMVKALSNVVEALGLTLAEN